MTPARRAADTPIPNNLACDFTFRTVGHWPRHLVPGAMVSLQADDTFGWEPRSELLWASVLTCGDDDLYRACVVSESSLFEELQPGDEVLLRLEHVVYALGETVTA